MIIRAFLLSLLPWGTEVVLALQSWSHPALDLFFTVVTRLGTEEFYLLLLPVLLWCLDKRLGLRVALLVLSSVYLNEALKALFQSPRPDPEVVRWVISADGWGFPSSHAQTTTALFGFLFLWLRPRRWAATLWLVPLLVSFSRLYLGVHYPQDVIGGILVGLAALACFNWTLEEPRIRRWERLGGWEQVGVLSIFTIGLSALSTSSYSVTAMGALLGVGSGALWERRAVRFTLKASSGEGPPLIVRLTPRFAREGRAHDEVRQALKLIVGLLLMLVVYGLGKILLPDAPTFRFVRYAILGGLATGVLPWLFLHWGWVDSPQANIHPGF